jgi:exopolysaccharide production protein ExoQ
MRSRSRELSSPVSQLMVAWILMIPIFIFASDGSLWFDSTSTGNTLRAGSASSFDSTTGPNLSKYYLIPVVLLIALLAAPRARQIAAASRTNAVFVVLSAYAMVSTLWSDIPLSSLLRACYLVANVVFAFYLLNRFNRGQQMQLLYYAGWIVVAASFILVLAFPQYGIGHRGVGDGGAINPWQGIFPHKNTCGVNTVYLLSASLFVPLSGNFSRVARGVFVALSLLLLAETQSRTAWIICACLFLYVGGMRLLARFQLRDRRLILVHASLAVAVLAVVGTRYYAATMYALGKDPTMDGRTTQWLAVIASIMKHPVLGYGYEALSNQMQGVAFNLSMAVGYSLPGIDSGYLNLCVGLGLIALALFVYSLIRAVMNAAVCLREKNSPYVVWCLSIVMLCVISNISERMMMNPNNLAWIMYIVACGGLSAEAARIRSAARA